MLQTSLSKWHYSAWHGLRLSPCPFQRVYCTAEAAGGVTPSAHSAVRASHSSSPASDLPLSQAKSLGCLVSEKYFGTCPHFYSSLKCFLHIQNTIERKLKSEKGEEKADEGRNCPNQLGLKWLITNLPIALKMTFFNTTSELQECFRSSTEPSEEWLQM